MKNLKLIGFLMILASSLMFIQCTTDTLVGPEGPKGDQGDQGIPGLAGTTGLQGIQGIPGLSGTDIATCVACHSNSHRDAINDAYDESGHATGTSWARGNSAGCAQCHSNQGFIEYQETGQVMGYSNPEPISCTGCHKAHRSFDFVNDENDMALRTLKPVTLIVDDTYIIDSKNESDLLGKSNTCVACHQPRHGAPDPADAEYAITSSHWGPHHGPQSTLLEGIQGFEYSSTGISADGSAGHKTNMSCVACHMSTVDEGHSWEPADYASSTCVKCHDAKPEVEGFTTGMAALAVKLENVVGWEYKYSVLRNTAGDPILDDGDLQFLDADGVVTDDSDLYVIEEDVDGVQIKVDVIGAVHDDSPNPGFYGQGATFTTDAAGAAFNYLFLLEDKSNGVHNPNYAKALIQQSNGAL
jgi:hypothetical protein